MKPLKWHAWAAALAGMAAMGTPRVFADTITIPMPLVDTWNSAVNPTYGYRATASAFGSGGNPLFEDLFVTQLLIFDSSGAAAPGLGVSNYEVESATVTLPRDPATSYVYDPTFDPLEVYTTGAADDPGSPLELYGGAFRGGFSAATYVEGTSTAAGTPWGPTGPAFGSGVRYAFPTDASGGSLRDVSSHVQGDFEVNPFAIGQIEGLTAGDTVSGPGEDVFELELTEDVLTYLRNGLNDGLLTFHVASHVNPGPGSAGAFPSFFNKESGLGSASLTLDVTVIPEPSTLVVLLLAVSAAALARKR